MIKYDTSFPTAAGEGRRGAAREAEEGAKRAQKAKKGEKRRKKAEKCAFLAKNGNFCP